MGLLDSIDKILNTISRTTSTADRSINEAQRVKRIGDTVGGALAKKCKFCGAVLKVNIEKQKGVCASCALKKL